MKYLRIENEKGLYCLEKGECAPIDQISKEDLLVLLDRALEEEFEMDPFAEHLIGNPAQRIVYKNLYERFSELTSDRSRFKDESEQLYKSAIDEYSTADDQDGHGNE